MNSSASVIFQSNACSELRLSETGLTTWSLCSTCPAFSHTVSDTGAIRDWREAKTPRARDGPKWHRKEDIPMMIMLMMMIKVIVSLCEM